MCICTCIYMHTQTQMVLCVMFMSLLRTCIQPPSIHAYSYVHIFTSIFVHSYTDSVYPIGGGAGVGAGKYRFEYFKKVYTRASKFPCLCTHLLYTLQLWHYSSVCVLHTIHRHRSCFNCIQLYYAPYVSPRL